MTFTVACKKFFGTKFNQTLSQFLEEIRKITPEDRKELTELMRKNGIEIEESGETK